MNMNDMAKYITEMEGQKVNLSIAQVKEVMRLTLSLLKGMSIEEIAQILKRIK